MLSIIKSMQEQTKLPRNLHPGRLPPSHGPGAPSPAHARWRSHPKWWRVAHTAVACGEHNHRTLPSTTTSTLLPLHRLLPLRPLFKYYLDYVLLQFDHIITPFLFLSVLAVSRRHYSPSDNMINHVIGCLLLYIMLVLIYLLLYANI